MSQDTLVVPRNYGQMIAHLAPISILSGLYGLWMGHGFDIVIVPFSVGCTTYLYWHNPTYSWRRNLDMATVTVMCLYQAYRALYAEYMFMYLLFHATGIASYLCGMHYYYNKEEHYIGMLFHVGIHILPNIGNMVLYSGKIE